MSTSAPQRILPLSTEAISQIHSSKHITTLKEAVISLLENSLDAGARKVKIDVDWRRGDCTVEDDGDGIPPVEFKDDGALGKMYCTSKRIPGARDSRNDLIFHGSTGTFLAELSALSLLSIASKHIDCNQSAKITFHRGRCIDRQCKDLPADKMHFPGFKPLHGTTITVRDLFGNLPVRVKQRAVASDASIEERSWYELKHGIVAVLLAWCAPCAIKIRDINSGSRTVNLSSYYPSIPTTLTGQNLGRLVGKHAKPDLRDNLPILFQSGFAPPESRRQWIPLSASTPSLFLCGLICLDPMPTKRCQFISIGVSPCHTNNGYFDLYDAVNRVFAQSDFGWVEGTASNEDVATRGIPDMIDPETCRTNGYSSRKPQARKGIDRFPMFYLQINFEAGTGSRADGLKSMNDASIKAIVDILVAASSKWLESNHFRPRNIPTRKSIKDLQPRGGQTDQSISSVRHDQDRLQSLTRERPPEAILPRMQGGVDDSGSIPRTTEGNQRRNIVDLSMDSAHPKWTTEAQGRGSKSIDQRCYSRMKIGNASSRFWSNGNACSKKFDLPVLGSAPPQASIPEDTSGDTGYRNIVSNNLNSTQGQQSLLLQSTNELAPKQDASSDSFGSVDDAEMVAAAEELETGQIPPGFTAANNMAESPCDDEAIEWVDPLTNVTFKVNSRTGVVLPAQGLTKRSRDPANEPSFRRLLAEDTKLSSTGTPFGLLRRSVLQSRNESRGDSESGRWLDGFLDGWENPVFARQLEESIPRASISRNGLLSGDGRSSRCSNNDWGHYFSRYSDADLDVKLSKAALKQVTVIEQVDKKFILCKVPSAVSANDEMSELNARADAKQLLVLVDQHAASERIVLEGLLRELCCGDDHGNTSSGSRYPPPTRPNSTILELGRPLRFSVSKKEHELFATYKPHFAEWGVVYELEVTTQTHLEMSKPAKPDFRISVRALPTVIAERCSNFPNLCIDMMRSEIWALAEGKKQQGPQTPSRAMRNERNVQSRQNPTETSPQWLHRISSCPQGILDMLNSRACRSAVMFNDELSRDQCVELLNELNKCVFPFVCGHGRVSVVPLVDLGDADNGETEFLGFVPQKSAGTTTFKSDVSWGNNESIGNAMQRWLDSLHTLGGN